MATLFEGSVKERVMAALLAGIIATLIVIFAAGFGPKALEFVNMNIVRVASGIAIFAIGMMIMGMKISDSIPTIIMVIGVIIGIVWK